MQWDDKRSVNVHALLGIANIHWSYTVEQGTYTKTRYTICKRMNASAPCSAQMPGLVVKWSYSGRTGDMMKYKQYREPSILIRVPTTSIWASHQSVWAHSGAMPKYGYKIHVWNGKLSVWAAMISVWALCLSVWVLDLSVWVSPTSWDALFGDVSACPSYGHSACNTGHLNGFNSSSDLWS